MILQFSEYTKTLELKNIMSSSTYISNRWKNSFVGFVKKEIIKFYLIPKHYGNPLIFEKKCISCNGYF